jgi:thiol-disulfide isomerase/thioredoxin
VRRARWSATTAAGLVTMLALAGCAGAEESDEAMATPTEQAATPAPSAEPEPAPEPAPSEAAEPAAAPAGGYVSQAEFESDTSQYASSDVVLFFNASWCPTCRVADANFQEETFPAGLTVVSVDFDDNRDLKVQYGVTVQHTFVQVDASGNEVAKWTGSNTVDEVAEQVV